MIWHPIKKCSVKTLLFDSVPIENYIFSLLHAEIDVGNKKFIHILIGLMKELNPLLMMNSI